MYNGMQYPIKKYTKWGLSPRNESSWLKKFIPVFKYYMNLH